MILPGTLDLVIYRGYPLEEKVRMATQDLDNGGLDYVNITGYTFAASAKLVGNDEIADSAKTTSADAVAFTITGTTTTPQSGATLGEFVLRIDDTSDIAPGQYVWDVRVTPPGGADAYVFLSGGVTVREPVTAGA